MMGGQARGKAVCVATNREAAEAGAAMLRNGGNAFDAAVAAGFVEAVVSPQNCGIGGYGAVGTGFLAGPGRLVAIDANAVAPKAATASMFPTIPGRDPNDYRLPDDRHKRGPLSVGVPGVLGGLLTVLETWGQLPRKMVMAPAIRHARDGVALTPGQIKSWHGMKGEPAPSGPAPDRSKRLVMPRLAETLEAIADEGAGLFYQGRIGRRIAEFLQARGGLITPDDMASYKALVVEPVIVEVRGHTLATAPPPSGGLTSLQIVALLDRLDHEGRVGEPGSARAFEAFLEILKVVWNDRLTELADPEWMRMPPADLLANPHLDRLQALALEGLAHPEPGHLVAPDPLRGTVHLASADAEGNLFAWTQTHGGGFGSGVMVPELEVVLGHGMCRFEPRPGWPNSIAPAKRPLHNMCPVVAIKAGDGVLASGASGGRTIVNNVAAITAALLVHRIDPINAVKAPRLQCETLEPAVIEKSAGQETIEALRVRGHQIREATRDAGNVHIIAREQDGWRAIAEPRLERADAVSG